MRIVTILPILALCGCIGSRSFDAGDILGEIRECKHSTECLLERGYANLDLSSDLAAQIIKAITELGPLYSDFGSDIELWFEVDTVLVKRGRYVAVARVRNVSSLDIYFYGGIGDPEFRVYYDMINPGWNG